jgi:pantoate--beta-alanine ligase
MDVCMKVISRIQAIRRLLAPMRGKKRIGLVPTMGAFHAGHLALMKRAKKECDVVVVSLFVNPTQFGPKEDFSAYPRDLNTDRKKAREAGVDILWTPTAEELYARFAERSALPSAGPSYDTFIEVGEIGQRWEGEVRPGHFRGVATVVAKLFQVVQPDVAYFGQKDYQQTCVIRQITRDLHFNVTVKVLPTVREADGLAMSSRNVRLSEEARVAAPVVYRALCLAARKAGEGELRGAALAHLMIAVIRRAVPDARVDYAALCDPKTLLPIGRMRPGETGILLLAARIGPVRLIDNLGLKAATD